MKRLQYIPSYRVKINSLRGLSFIEVMVTLAILSFGLVMILKSFNASINHLIHVNHRFRVTHILDNRLSEIQRSLRARKMLPVSPSQLESYPLQSQDNPYQERFQISAVDNYIDIFELDYTIQWAERGSNKRLSRTAYISDIIFPQQ